MAIRSGVERVGARHDLLDERAPNRRPDVDVGELDDPESVLRARQRDERDPHPTHLDRLAHRAERGGRQAADQQPRSRRGEPRERTFAARGSNGGAAATRRRDRRQQAQQIGRNDDREQQKHDAQPDVARPDESPTEIALSATEDQRDGHARREQREKRATDRAPGRGPARIAHQSGPKVVMNAAQQTERNGNERNESTHRPLF